MGISSNDTMKELIRTMKSLQSAMHEKKADVKTPDKTSSTNDMKELKKLESSLKKPDKLRDVMYAKVMKNAAGKMVVGFLKSSEISVKNYYQKMSAIASGFFNKTFGKVLEDFRPIIDSIKATAVFALDITKTLAKTVGSLVLDLVKLPFTIGKSMWSMGSTIYGFLRGKKTSPGVSVAKKQLSVEQKILKTLGKQIKYLDWIEKNTAYLYRKGTIGSRAWSRGKKAAKGGILPSTGGSVLGSVAGAAGSVVGGTGSVIGSIFSGIGGIGGFFAKMVPVIGGVLGPLVSVALPTLLGAGLLKGLWDSFKETEVGKWFNTEMWIPFQKWWIKEIWAPIKTWWDTDGKKSALEFGKNIWLGFMSLMPEWMQRLEGSTKEENIRKYGEKTGRTKEETEWEISNRKLLRQILGVAGAVAGVAAAVAAAPMTGGVTLLTAGGLGTLGAAGGVSTANMIGDLIYGKFKDGGAVPIIAHEGEYVVKKSAVDKVGLNYMDALNNGKIPHFQDGGGVPKTYTAPVTTTISSPNIPPYSAERSKSLLQKYFKNEWETAAKIIGAESGGYADAHRGINPESGDFGLFQINYTHKNDLINKGIIKNSMRELFNPEKNMQAAAYLYNKRHGWGDWYMSEKRWSNSKLDADKLNFKFGFKQGKQSSSPFTTSGNASSGLFGSFTDMLGSLGSLASTIGEQLFSAMGFIKPNELSGGSGYAGVSSNRTGGAETQAANEIARVAQQYSEISRKENQSFNTGGSSINMAVNNGSGDAMVSSSIPISDNMSSFPNAKMMSLLFYNQSNPVSAMGVG